MLSSPPLDRHAIAILTVMDTIRQALPMSPVPCLAPAFSMLKFISSSADQVQGSKSQLGVLVQLIAHLLLALNQEYRTKQLLQDRTSVALTDLSRLLDQISDFMQKQVSSSFLMLLFAKNGRIARIDRYYALIGGVVESFQIPSLFSIDVWQMRNHDARAADQGALNQQMFELEANHQRLRDILHTPGSSIPAMIVSLQRRVDQRSGDTREMEFFTHILQFLIASSGLRIELENWMVTSYEVEFGPKIGAGGFGQVYMGTWNDTQVALKVLRTEAGAIPSSAAIRQEIETWSVLRHTHILQFLGANEFDDQPFIVMPYMQNGNARDYVRRHRECNRLQIVESLAFLLYD